MNDSLAMQGAYASPEEAMVDSWSRSYETALDRLYDHPSLLWQEFPEIAADLLAEILEACQEVDCGQVEDKLRRLGPRVEAMRRRAFEQAASIHANPIAEMT